jgi:hypothetical protein
MLHLPVLLVLYRNPNADFVLPSHILPTTYICRYSLVLGDSPDMPGVEVLPYAGENDEWHEMTLAAVQKKLRSSSDEEANKVSGRQRSRYSDIASNSSASGIGSDSESDTSFHSPRKRKSIEEGIDEGTTEQRFIRVGKDHQVSVPPFIPNINSVSRHPIMVWKPEMIHQEGIDNYVCGAAEILTPFLRERRWTQEEPYAPFPTARLEEISKSLKQQRLPTLSSVSTVSSLATRKNDALREVDTDALLRNLHASQYDVKSALVIVSASPQDFVTVWTPQEKSVFDACFRRYSGSLRAIYKGMGNKELQDVIDYHYRFKIPDQFRRFQDRKREQAVRMLECIETRRNLNAPILVPNNLRTQSFGVHNTGSGNWYVRKKEIMFDRPVAHTYKLPFFIQLNGLIGSRQVARQQLCRSKNAALEPRNSFLMWSPSSERRRHSRFFKCSRTLRIFLWLRQSQSFLKSFRGKRISRADFLNSCLFNYASESRLRTIYRYSRDAKTSGRTMFTP